MVLSRVDSSLSVSLLAFDRALFLFIPDNEQVSMSVGLAGDGGPNDLESRRACRAGRALRACSRDGAAAERHTEA